MSETTRQASGADAARQALAAWKTRRTPGTGPAPKRKTRRTRTDRAGGRDPIGLGGVLGRLAAEQGWNQGLDGGNILDQWTSICPTRYVGHLEPVAFDPEHGLLSLRPGSHAYATELRMATPMLVRELNAKLGRTVVRNIRALPVGTIGATIAAAAEPEPAPVQPAPEPVRTRDTASPGYLRALAEHEAHKRTRETTLDVYVRQALERQNTALRARREDETAFTEAVAQQELLEAQAEPPAGTLEASIRAARTYSRQAHTGRAPRRLFEAS